MYLSGTHRCFSPSVCQLSTPSVALNSYQLADKAQNRTNWNHVSSIQAAKPGYVYQYKSQTERIQSLMGRLSLKQCR
jgi:hypothetical protein